MTALPDAEALAERIDAALRARSVPERAAAEKAYLKSSLAHYGTSVPAMRAAVREALAGRRPGHDALVAVAVALWDVPVHERRAAAVELLETHRDVLGISDADLVERLLRESRTWALVDGLAASVVGPLTEVGPGWEHRLDRWASDPDFWLRRSALLAHLVPLRTGGGDWGRFARYAEAMLAETNFFIRKAIGWVLRDTAKTRPDLVFGWLLPRATRVSGVTVREAVKALRPDQRDAVLAARSETRPSRSPTRPSRKPALTKAEDH
jgi:3-methyladenine DNA glycosylase AlkD